jgi:hypothetical protein
MFESIKSALTKETENTGSKLKDYIKTEAGNTYTVRLLPNMKNPAKTFFHYYTFGWNSYATGKYVSAVSPSTWSQRDPIAEERYRILRNGTEEEKKKAEVIRRTENWLVNVYVVNDPVNADHNGKIKILRFGRQLHKIIMDGIEGEDAAELGPRIFDLSAKGVNLKIKVEKQGDYPTYVSSKFSSPKEVEGLDEDNYDKVYKAAFDLESYVTVKSYDDLKEMLNQHYFCKTDTENSDGTALTTIKESTPVVKAPVVTAPKKEETVVEDESIANLLKDL